MRFQPKTETENGSVGFFGFSPNQKKSVGFGRFGVQAKQSAKQKVEKETNLSVSFGRGKTDSKRPKIRFVFGFRFTILFA